MNSPHPELEALAELADPSAVDTPPTDAQAELVAHVAACPICTGDLEALRGVRETLRSLPPVPMPADVAERLEAALLAARAEDAAGGPAEDAAKHDSAERTVVPLISPARRRWQAFPYSAAAGVLVLAAVGTAIVIGITHSGESKKSSTAAASVPAPSGAAAAGGLPSGTPTLTSGTSYTSADLPSQITAVITSSIPGAAQRFDALNNPDFGAQSSAAAAGASASAPAASSAPAPQAAASSPAAASVAGAAPAPVRTAPVRTAPSGPLADPAALARCVQILAPGQDHSLVLVDYATFNGVPSTIIVLADPDVAGKLDVYVEADTANCANQEVTYVTFLNPAASASP